MQLLNAWHLQASSALGRICPCTLHPAAPNPCSLNHPLRMLLVCRGMLARTHACNVAWPAGHKKPMCLQACIQTVPREHALLPSIPVPTKAIPFLPGPSPC